VETCATCGSELATEWNFCVHCGTPVPPRPEDRELDPIPSAIRPEPALLPAPGRRVEPRLVFGITMAAVGLLVVVYALISLLGANG
jgi:hypothetical protein